MSSLAVKHAVKVVGSNAALAAALDVHESAISLWKTGRRLIPAQYCLALEEATKREVTRYDLRPDVFGEAPSKTARSNRSH